MSTFYIEATPPSSPMEQTFSSPSSTSSESSMASIVSEIDAYLEGLSPSRPASPAPSFDAIIAEIDAFLQDFHCEMVKQSKVSRSSTRTSDPKHDPLFVEFPAPSLPSTPSSHSTKAILTNLINRHKARKANRAAAAAPIVPEPVVSASTVIPPPVVDLILSEWDTHDWGYSSEALCEWLNARWKKAGYSLGKEMMHNVLRENGRVVFMGLEDEREGSMWRGWVTLSEMEKAQ